MLRDLIMKRTFYFTFCCVLTLGIVFKSCKKDDDTDPEEVVEQQFIDWGDVYFIGYRMDEYLGAPNYYKNNIRSEEHTSELQSREKLVCRLLLEKKKTR